MSDPGGHFFHDLIEGVVIWDGGAGASETAPIEVPAEAESVPETHDGHEHIEPTHAGENDVTIAAADHSHDASTEIAAADISHEGDTAG